MSPRQSIRRVVIPSGKTIEVVYFDDEPADAIDPEVRELHICGNESCRSHLVQPVEWDECGPRHWEMSLRCPSCGWEDGGIFTQEAITAHEEELDRGAHALADDLKRVTHANMEDEIELMITAIEANHIMPMDF